MVRTINKAASAAAHRPVRWWHFLLEHGTAEVSWWLSSGHRQYGEVPPSGGPVAVMGNG
jgi:hypothetical protein